MGTEQKLDDILEHYGIKGMRWGVRRTDEQLARARGRRKKEGKPVTPTKKSADAAAAEESRKKAKKGGVEALSNEELQQLNTRLNLEQQYTKLAGPSGTKSAGAKFAKDLVVNVGKQQVTRVANEQAAKAIAKTLAKAALKK